ncbi:hypothetical protein BU17DRAFT_103848 [Hysterangium stoloniferum]|nr:hypothetical protein BU17DRAFT_103848 [Hysterangium stoloniferum]
MERVAASSQFVPLLGPVAGSPSIQTSEPHGSPQDVVAPPPSPSPPPPPPASEDLQDESQSLTPTPSLRKARPVPVTKKGGRRWK